MRPRLIPVLLLREGGLVKTKKFKGEVYIGDPINTVKLYNDMEVDEIVILDIDASKNGDAPDFELIKDFACECFMPVCYGGGISSIEQARTIFQLGIEKISLNTTTVTDLNLLSEITSEFGVQSVVASVDIKKSLFGKYQVYQHTSGKTLKEEPIQFIKSLEAAGAGEILIQMVDREGTQSGPDLEFIKSLAGKIQIPLISSGGLSGLDDIKAMVNAGSDAVAGGAYFVFRGTKSGVLVSYPSPQELDETLGKF